MTDNVKHRSKPFDAILLSRCKTFTDVLAMNDMEAIRFLARSWGIVFRENIEYRELVPKMAENIQYETHRRIEEYERTKR